jgi:hypothetical protein
MSVSPLVQEDSPLLAPPPEDVDDDEQDTGGAGDQGGDDGEAPTPKMGLGSSWSKAGGALRTSTRRTMCADVASPRSFMNPKVLVHTSTSSLGSNWGFLITGTHPTLYLHLILSRVCMRFHHQRKS